MRVSLGKPLINEEMKLAVLKVMDSGQYHLGEQAKLFEQELAEYFGTKHCILTNSATTGLMLSLKAMGIEKGNEVIVPSHTAFPTAEAIFHTGAKPVYCDITKDYTIDVEQAEKLVTHKTKAILPVHLYGQPANMDMLRELCDEEDLWLLEDCAQAHSAEYHKKKVGSIGEAGVISFYSSKNMMVAGDGGAILTNLDEIANKVKALRNHGRKERYVHEYIGYNARFNSIQAAIGREQLKLLDDWTDQRRRIAKLYCEKLEGTDLVLPKENDGTRHVYHLFVVQSNHRDELKEFLGKRNIQTEIHYPIPCHLQPGSIKELGEKTSIPRTEEIVDKILSLPMHPFLTEEQVTYVTDSIKRFEE